MKHIYRVPVLAWLLFIGTLAAGVLYANGSQTAGIIIFVLVPISHLLRLISPSPENKKEEVGLALLMRPVGYTVIVIVGLIIQIMGLYSYTYDWLHKPRSPKKYIR